MHIYGIQKNINSPDEPTYREEMEMQMQRMDRETQCGKERVGQVDKIALTYIMCKMNNQWEAAV